VRSHRPRLVASRAHQTQDCPIPGSLPRHAQIGPTGIR
jgi:hypothetical protein